MAPELEVLQQQKFGPSSNQIDARQDVEKPVQIIEDTDEYDQIVPLSRRNTQAMIADAGRIEIMSIASQWSRRRSSIASLGHDPSLPGIDEDPNLDPQSDSFDLGKWIRHLVSEMRREGQDLRSTGVS